MIERKLFDKEMKRICRLIGQNPIQGIIEQFYEELKGYELSDFQQACKDREMLREMLRFKINLITLEDFILKYRGMRMDRESTEKRQKLDEEAKAFFKKEGIPDEIKKFITRFKRI